MTPFAWAGNPSLLQSVGQLQVLLWARQFISSQLTANI
jgi:hypothetical protein